MGLNNNLFLYNKSKKNSNRGNDGFTLVEMIVTLVVLGIILSLSAMGILAWQDWSRFNKANEYAQTLFTAGQNQLSEYNASGEIEAFEDDLAKRGITSDVVDLESIFYEEGKNYSDNSVWITKAKGKVFYAKCDKGDYTRYVNGDPSVSESAKVVFELLEEYVFDPTILDNSICIEFSAGDAQVFSVSFSDANSGFTYDNTSSLTGMVSIAKRWEEFRRDRMIGYYGVDTLSAHVNNGKPVISNVKLLNEDTLNLSFKLSKLKNAMNLLTYDIDVYDKRDPNNPRLRIILDGSKLKNYSKRSAIDCDIIRYKNNNGVITEEALGKAPVLAWIDEKQAIRVVLDAADFQATSTLYKEEFDIINSLAMITTDFSKTYSFHRFGLEADEIFCAVKARGVNYKTSAKKISNSSDVYFSKTEKKESLNKSNATVQTIKYTIKNARHLYNIRYVEDVSDNFSDDIKKYIGGLTGNLTNFEFYVAEDIDWNEFLAQKSYFNSNGRIKINVNDPVVAYNPEENVSSFSHSYFPSFIRLRVGDKFYSDDKKISNLIISQLNNDLQGLYPDVKAEGNQNTQNDNKEDKVVKPVGLFNYNFGKVEKVTLDDIIVNGEYHVGAFCGNNGGFLKELKVLNSNEKSIVSGKEYVGGIAGYCVGIENDILLSELNESGKPVISYEKNLNEAQINGDVFVGGIFGSIILSQKHDINLLVKECINKGSLKVNRDTDKDKAGFFGGISGFIGNYFVESKTNDINHYNYERISIVDCLSYMANRDINYDSLAEEKELAQDELNELKGIFVGGIAGYNYNGLIKNSGTVIDEDGNLPGVYGFKFVGGISGYNRGIITGEKDISSETAAYNYADVVGSDYVGGIAGCNADYDDELLMVNDKDFNYLDSFIEKPKTTIMLKSKIENYNNRGDVYATNSYAGAISGYNVGWIYNSICKNDNAEENYCRVFSSNYAGGVVGYNNGIIGNTNRIVNEDDFADSIVDDTLSVNERKISNNCYVTGKNYIGGIVGYNDEDSVIEDYVNGNGYVRGINEESYFVGGFAGFNSSVDLLMSKSGEARTLESGVEEINGQYFVGGYIGANIVNVEKYKKKGGITPLVESEETSDKTTETTEESTETTEEITETTETTETTEEPIIIADGTARFVIRDENNFWQSDGYFCTIVDVYVTNNSSVEMKHYSVYYGDAKYPFEFDANNSWGFDRDDAAKTISNKPENYSYIPSGQTKNYFGFTIKGKDINQIKAVCSQTYPVTNLNDVNNVVAANNKVSLEIKCDDLCINGETIPWYGTYNANIINNTNEELSVWKIEMDIEDGTEYLSGWNGIYSVDKARKKLVITNESYNKTLAPNGTINYGFRMTFNDKTVADNFVNNHYVIYFNGEKVGEGGSNTNPPTDPTEPENPEETDSEDIEYSKDADDDVRDNDRLDTVSGDSIQTNFVNTISANQINAKAFAGGYAGFNMFVGNDDFALDENYVYLLQEALKEKLSNTNNIKDKFDIVDNIYNSGLEVGAPVKSSNIVFVVNGINNEYDNKDRSISADICVGGVLGINENYTRLYIRNVNNIISIVSNGAIQNNTLGNYANDYLGKEFLARYSFAGGIIGYLYSNGNLYNCTNESSVLKSGGTYRGALCEVNSGRIISCRVKNFDCSTNEYVGGICGYNTTSGIIKKTVVSNAEIKGLNVVGAVAAYNEGFVSKTRYDVLKVSVAGTDKPAYQESSDIVSHGVAGGIVGYNGLNGYVSFLSDNGKVEIVSSGKYVGGLVGVNSGIVRSKATKDKHAIVDGFISGTSEVGGVIGLNDSDSNVRYVDNVATVSATDGGAGGIIGANESLGVIYHCENYGNISATGNGNCGGITASNIGVISHCENHNSISTEKGLSGGIVAKNEVGATIRWSRVYKKNKDGYLADQDVLIVSSFMAGGIVGDNYGEVTNCSFDANISANGNETDTVFAGGIAGTNNEEGIVEKCLIGKYADCKIEAGMTDNSFACVGGIIGENNGYLTNCENVTNTKNVNISCNLGYLGGIIGLNGATGKLEGTSEKHISTNSNWVVSSNSDVGALYAGGIIGLNKSISKIAYCDNYARVDTLKSHSDHNVFAAGIIGYMDNIDASKCNINNCTNYGIVKSGAFSSGIVGSFSDNNWTISDCSNYGNITGEIISGIAANGNNSGNNEVNFINCNNHGLLEGKKFYDGSSCKTYAAGIYANYREAGEGTYNLTKCINTGLILGDVSNENKAGMVAISRGRGYYFACRNYAPFINGIYGQINVKEASIINCFDFGGVDYKENSTTAIGESIVKHNNYFVNKYNNTSQNAPYGAESVSGTKLRVSGSNNNYTLKADNETKKIEGLKINIASEDYYNDQYDYAKSSTEGYRIPAYLEVDSKLDAFVYSHYLVNEKLPQPDNIILDTKEGMYRFTWNPQAKAYCYEVKYEIKDIEGNTVAYEEETISEVYGKNYYDILVNDDCIGGQVKFSVRAIAGNEKINNDASFSSDFATYDASALTKLDSPKLHLEYTGNGNAVAVLDNADAYYNNESPIDCNILVSVDKNKNTSIDPTVGYSKKPLELDIDKEHIIISSSAKTKEGNNEYTNSLENNTLVDNISDNKLNELDNDMFKIDYHGFYMTDENDIMFRLSVESGNLVSNLGVNSEFVSYDEELKCDVSYGSNYLVINANTKQEVELTGNINKLIGNKNLAIKNYLWSLNDGAVIYGHVAGKDISKNELYDFEDNEYYIVANKKSTKSHTSIWEKDKKGNSLGLKDGYIIRLQDNGKYTVIYSSLLAGCKKLKSPQCYDKEYKLDANKNSYVSGDEEIKYTSKPDISDTLECKDNKVTFVWDDKKKAAKKDDQSGNLYYVSVYGITDAGDKLSLIDNQSIVENKISILADEACISYNVFVTKSCRIDENKKILEFSNCGNHTYYIKRNIDKPVIDNVIYEKNAAGSSENMNFKILWSTDYSKLEKSEIKGYEIIVCPEAVSTSSDALISKTYFVALNNESIVDKNAIDVSKTYEVSEDGKKHLAVIDLSLFEHEDSVAVYVKAIAKDDSNYYSDSEFSALYKLSIPNKKANE